MVFFALSLVVLMGMAALALDVSHLYGVKSQLQVAADAAALAGANALTGSSDTVKKNNAADEATSVTSRIRPTCKFRGCDRQCGATDSGDAPCGGYQLRELGPHMAPAFSTARTPLNAVRVVANRLGGTDQPTVQNWLIKVLAAAGDTSFNQTGVSATAIACRTKLGLSAGSGERVLDRGWTYISLQLHARDKCGSVYALPGRGDLRHFWGRPRTETTAAETIATVSHAWITGAINMTAPTATLV